MANVKAFLLIGGLILLSIVYTTEGAEGCRAKVFASLLMLLRWFYKILFLMQIVKPKTCSMNGEKCDVLPCCPHPTGDRVCYNFNKTCGPLLV